MIQTPKNSNSYRNDIIQALSNTGIKQLSPGAKARAFADAVGDLLGESESRQFANITDTLLPYAVGTSLDFIGELFGVVRITRQDAKVNDTENNLRFYVRRGTFGDINNGDGIVIPSGTRIYTNADNGPVFVTEEMLLPSSESSFYFSATSLYPGTFGNAPSGVLTRHNFTNYADRNSLALLVTNDSGIVGGRDTEDDESYRFRIALKLQSRAGANEASIRFDLLQLPGIQDVVFQRAAGTFKVFIYGISLDTSDSVIQNAQNIINDRVAYPLTGVAIAPELIGISLTTTLHMKAGVSTGERGNIVAAAISTAESYINNLYIGQTLVLNEIADRIRTSDQRIIDVGDPNRPLSEVFIWRSRADDSRYSRFLINNYTPFTGERISVETRTNAINILSD